MEQIFNEAGYPLDMSKLEFLSNRGSEFIVYKYFDLVIKLYKKSYMLEHLTEEELNVLKGIKTKRILMPSGILYNQNGELQGYEMPYIGGQKNILYSRVRNFFDELEVLRDDIELLSANLVFLFDVDILNTIYNGGIYLIDPGNYFVNGFNIVFSHLNLDDLTIEDKLRLIREWNYNKINILIEMLLFENKNNIDFYKFRQIVQFLMKVRKDNNLDYDLECLQMFFKKNVVIRKVINNFIKENIKDDSEKALLLMLKKRYK